MSIGQRLKEERERIGLSQEQLGIVGGVKKLAQFRYENGDTYPNAQYLTEVVKIGIDVNYVLFGVRSNAELTSEEQQLLETFRAAPPAVRQFMLGGIASSAGMKIEGNHNQQHNYTDADNMEIKGDNNVQISGRARKK
jgi:transcriptional regulator, XRE family